MELAPGQVLADRYEVLELLVRSEAAVVYRVRHQVLGTAHAVKVLLNANDGTSDLLRRLAALSHPNLVAVTDRLSVDERPAWVTEWIAGPSLAQRVDDLDADRAVALARGLTRGLLVAHEAGLVRARLGLEEVRVQDSAQGPVAKWTAEWVVGEGTAADIAGLAGMLEELGPHDELVAAIAACRDGADAAGVLAVLPREERSRTLVPAVEEPVQRSLPWLWIGVGVAGVALVGAMLTGVVLAGVGVWSVAGGPDIVDGPCPGRRGEVVGWVWTGRGQRVAEGQEWTLKRDRNVRADFPREGNQFDADAPIVCVLPKGTRLRVDQPAVGPRDSWVPVVAGAVNPETPPPPAPPPGR